MLIAESAEHAEGNTRADRPGALPEGGMAAVPHGAPRFRVWLIIS